MIDDDDLCPNCISPWKCNGPHVPALPDPAPEIDGAMRFDTDKPRMDLVDMEAVEELAKVLTFGAKKYADHNWRLGMNYSRVTASMLRHIAAFQKGEDNDQETGLPHMAHVMCNAMFLIWYQKHRAERDDRYADPG
jgi:hypothetical protein